MELARTYEKLSAPVAFQEPESCPQELRQAINFDYLAADLIDHALTCFDQAVQSYNSIGPQWFGDDGYPAKSFIVDSQAYYKMFVGVDCFAVSARMASVLSNAVVCIEEGPQRLEDGCAIPEWSVEGLSKFIDAIDQSDGIEGEANQKALAYVKNNLSGRNKPLAPFKRQSGGEPTARRSKKCEISDFNPSDYADSQAKFHGVLVELAAKTDEALLSGFPSFIYPHQKQTLLKVIRDFCGGRHRLLVTKPTGTGKTAILYALVKMFALRGILITIVVPSSAYLCAQVAECIVDFDRENGDGSLAAHIGLYSPTFGKASLAPIVCVSQGVLTRRMTKKGKIKPDLGEPDPRNIFKCFRGRFHPRTFAFYLADEGHHMDARGFRSLLVEMPHHPVIGVSAST